MPFDFKFPDVGEGITEGEIVRWHVKEGDKVKRDQVLVEIETDKAVVEIPSPLAGVILKIPHKEGDTIKVGETLVLIGEMGEKVSEKTPEKSVSVVGVLEEAPEEVTEAAKEVVKEIVREEAIKPEHVLATPATRRLARELGVDLPSVLGTGLEGRITEGDVRKAAMEQTKAEKKTEIKVTKKYDIWGYIEHVPLKGIRKVTARKMVASISTAAHVATMDEADVTDLWKIREREKIEAAKKNIHLTFLPFIIKACIAALKEHPFLNASMDDEHEEIILKKYYNIGIAVDLEGGLIVPVIKGADQKSILQLSKEIEELAEKAKNRTHDLMDLKGSTFTITNIGSIGGKFATPIINYPEAGILGPGRIYEKPVVRDEKIVIRKILPLSLSFDHRILDGAEAQRFMNDLIKRLEDPELILIEGD